jgi:hypothetical protein
MNSPNVPHVMFLWKWKNHFPPFLWLRKSRNSLNSTKIMRSYVHSLACGVIRYIFIIGFLEVGSPFY